MNKTIIPAFVISILLFATVASASVSSVTTSASSSRATTGTSVTITASITATGTETNSVQFISTPSGITVSDPASGQYESVSMSTTPVSKTFTISAGTADTYSYYVQSGGTSSTSQTIVFVNPSTLTVSGSPSSTTKASGQTFTLSINLQNSQSDAITTSYKLTCPSGFSASGDSSCGETKTTTVSGSSTSNLQWTMTVGGSSSSGTLTLQVGSNTDAFSSTVTCSDCVSSSSTPSPSSGDGGGGEAAKIKVTTQRGKATITVPSIAAGKMANVTISKTEDMAVNRIEITVKNSVKNIQIVVEKLAQKPATVTQEVTGKVYNYIEVSKTNITDADVDKTKINFKVEKNWITTNNVDESTIVLNRYVDNKWNKLTTTKVSSDADNIYFDAESPGLSVFAISGESKAGEPTAPTEGEKPTGGEKPPVAGEAKLPKVDNTTYIIIAIVVIAVAIFIFRNKIFSILSRR